MSSTPSEFFATRDTPRAAFLSVHLRGASTPILIGEDWGTRRYYRTSANNLSYILMESVPDDKPFAAPGHRIADFIRLAKALRAAGLHAPAIAAADEAEGYVLMEDMGDVSFYAALSNGADEQDLYGLSVDVLKNFENAFPGNPLGLPDYHATHIHIGRRRVIDWYAPLARGATMRDGAVDDYLAVWDGIEKGLPACPKGFVHGDYHAQNLMLCAGETGLLRCGILDYQGAMTGPLAYDLSNLLGDIRRDISPDLEAAMIARRTAGMSPERRDVFMAWYRVLKAQFHCRVIGQVIRLASMGKPGHMRHMERLQRYMRDGLKDPVLAPLAAWFKDESVAFDAPVTYDADAVKRWVRSDAF